ncbi:ecotropic viral integration site [Boothiomyces sp. JEL0866]|nr:ecotropic viral integration site [Boothiomyces sp. JEL0866]
MEKQYPRSSSLPKKQFEWSISNFSNAIYNQATKLAPSLWTEEEQNIPNEESEYVQSLLSQLNKVNSDLQSDPKSVTVTDGEIKVQPKTRDSLTKIKSGDSNIEFWTEYIIDDEGKREKYKQLAVAKVRSAPIPSELRKQIWVILSKANLQYATPLYKKLLKMTSPCEREILLDVHRTFPDHEMFKEKDGDGQKALFRILKAYSIYDNSLGFCQGMPFCVGPLLMQNIPEEEVFAVFVALMGRIPKNPILDDLKWDYTVNRIEGTRSLFTTGLDGLDLILYQHSYLVAEILPDLAEHFTEFGVAPSTYATQWFLTFFASCFPIDVVFRIYDIMLAEGPILILIRISVAILSHNQDLILSANDLELIFEILKGNNMVKSYEGKYEMIIAQASELAPVINEKALKDLLIEYNSQFE